jgi:hypothetical protein
MPPEFECRREVTLAATPEEVWDAVATAAGNAAWLFPSGVDPEGPDTKAWEPPHHFAVRSERGDWFNALEFEIEGREGGTTVLRYMHSGIFVDDWDNQYDSVQQHTDFYLHTLGEYLRHFGGRSATFIGDPPQGIAGPPGSATSDGFERLQRALGLEPAADEGDTVHLAPAGLEPIDGVIGYRRANFIGIRTADALYCLFGRNAFGASVAVAIHSFAPDVDAEAAKRRWREWLELALR